AACSVRGVERGDGGIVRGTGEPTREQCVRRGRVRRRAPRVEAFLDAAHGDGDTYSGVTLLCGRAPEVRREQEPETEQDERGRGWHRPRHRGTSRGRCRFRSAYHHQ